MKKLTVMMIWFLTAHFLPGFAQENKSRTNVTADLVSNYIWRGTKLGIGPAIQPGITLSSGAFTLGSWGNYCLSSDEAGEADLYASLNLGNISLGLTSYYFIKDSFFRIYNHAIELNGGLSLGHFSLSANYILNEGGGAVGGDTYIEASYSAGNVTFFTGGGNGWYTPDNRFNLCNVGIKVTKNIPVTDRFSFPLSGSLILNPASEQLFLVAAISL